MLKKLVFIGTGAGRPKKQKPTPWSGRSLLARQPIPVENSLILFLIVLASVIFHVQFWFFVSPRPIKLEYDSFVIKPAIWRFELADLMNGGYAPTLCHQATDYSLTYILNLSSPATWRPARKKRIKRWFYDLIWGVNRHRHSWRFSQCRHTSKPLEIEEKKARFAHPAAGKRNREIKNEIK